MPRSPILILAAAGCAATALAADVTIVVEFDGPYSDRSVREMKRETEEIVKSSGLRLDWRSRGDLSGGQFTNLVVARFTGNCTFDTALAAPEIRGPLAFTYSSEGEVMPFTEVACDRVAATVRPAMWGDDFARPDYLMGRALGRVLAHELVHILTRSAVHGQEGIAQPALSGGQLIGAPLRLSRDDLERLRRGLTGQ